MAGCKVQLSLANTPREFFHQGVRYKIAVFPDGPTLRWTVYGGEDGSVLVYKPKWRRWERLTPTKKDHDYLVVSLAKKGGRFWQQYVHHIILHAFHGPKPQFSSRGKHLSDDPDDNRPENLEWGSASENAKEAHRHRKQNTAPKSRRVRVPIRRDVYERLRRISQLKGASLEAFIERRLVAFLEEAEKPLPEEDLWVSGSPGWPD